MRSISGLLLAALLQIAACGAADAATCIWQGGTSNWDASTTASWSCGHVPVAADTATFDGTSGSGTATLTTDPTLGGLTISAYTGTLTVRAHNLAFGTAAAFTDAQTGVHTLNMGSGTWTFGATGSNSTPWAVTSSGATYNAQTSTILFNGAGAGISRAFSGGGKTYNNLTISSNFLNFSAGNNTFSGTVTITAPATIIISNGTTQSFATLTDSGTGTGAQNAIWNSTVGTTGATTIINLTNASTLHWVALRGITFTGGVNFTAQNSFDNGGNTISGGGTLSITAPSGGGGGGYVF